MCDYLDKMDTTIPFYHRFPSLENFKKQLDEKSVSFSEQSRKILVSQLEHQYRNDSVSESTEENIQSLLKDTTFTITTGHQLNLFTGPLYFLYKIISAINLTEALNRTYPESHFVPVYWMATEDHDFEEINYFNFNGKKVAWERESGGAVGELSTEGLEEVLEVLKTTLGGSSNAQQLLKLFKEGYVKHDNLADATRYIANELFKEYGLVIIDGNDAELKKAFVPYAERELLENLSFERVTETTERLLKNGYGEQVHPREINLFYIKEGLRERIIAEDGTFYVNDSDLSFDREAILEELRNHPERFSPNALLRPLYQEAILPNLGYIGGGGELAYWFQLKDYFETVKVPFPILLLRNSVLLVPENRLGKLSKLEVDITRLFQKQDELKTSYTHQISNIEIDFSVQRNHLKKQFEDLYTLAKETDASFLGAVGAQEKKQLNGLDHLEKRLLKAQKRKLKDRLERLTAIQDELFPNQSLQERFMNFSEFYLDYGEKLVQELKKELDPLSHEFTILYL
ncbi:MAG: bacillithiol biosynthesis cysteine-adding enzyme BshC [Aureisphaera sp.]